MRREPFAAGSFIHVVKRGTRGSNIVRDDHDRWRFLKLLKYLNDMEAPRNWERDVTKEHIDRGFARPDHWRKPKPYVSVLSYCLMDNHFHLLLREREDGGVSKFMQRLCTSMALSFNARHKERGTLFESAYVARTVNTDEHLQYVNAYIQIKNAFECFPGGIRVAMRSYNDAYDWAQQHPFVSLGEYAGIRNSQLLDRELIHEVFPSYAAFKKFSRDVMYGRSGFEGEIDDLLIDG